MRRKRTSWNQNSCIAALHSPSTGIIDSHAFMLACKAKLKHMAQVAFNTRAAGGTIRDDGIYVRTQDVEGVELDPGPASSSTPRVTARSPLRTVWRVCPLRNPCLPHSTPAAAISLSGRSPSSASSIRFLFRRTGVHLTLDMAAARFGPDVEWIDGSTTPSIRGAATCSTRRSGDTGCRLPTARFALLRRRSAETVRRERTAGGLSHRWSFDPRGRGLCQSVRHREPRPDVQPAIADLVLRRWYEKAARVFARPSLIWAKFWENFEQTRRFGRRRCTW